MDTTRYKHPLPVLAMLIAFAANLGFAVGPVSLSFFLGIFLIAIVYMKFPQYAIIKKDMHSLLFFSFLSLVSLFFSPVSLDGSSIFAGLQIVYWFLLANIFSNVCNVIEIKLFQKGIILAILVYFISFILTSGDNNSFTENSASCIVVTIWPLGLLLFRNRIRLLYVFFVLFCLYIIGSRTGIVLILIQIIILFLVRKVSPKKMVATLLLLILVFSLFSLPKVRLSIAEVFFPNDVGMQTLIETPEVVFQLDKSWVQRRIQQEKSKQVMSKNPFFGIGPLNFQRYNIGIDTSKLEDVDDRALNAELGHSDNRSSHNSYFQLLAENGLVGSLVVFFILSGLLVKLYNRRNQSEIFVILLISAAGLFSNLFMVSMFWGTSTWMFLGIYSGYVRYRIKPGNS